MPEPDSYTKHRVFRAEDELWRDYGDACAAEGVKRSDDLRAYLQRKVRTWKRKQAKEARDT